MSNTKILALYLPQYYETDYNNDWWGKGYTEWTACKQAKPLFNRQHQPKLPMNDHFYDLSHKEEIAWQISLAKEYGIDGFVIYQYYSCNNSSYGKKNGKNASMLLEKPTEIIRDNPDLDLPFCLYWANHSWRRTWFGQDPTVLWSQEYGDENDWKEFFYYNLQYFKDPRYILINNKPVFFIFAVWHFKEINSFMECWNRLAKENGFDGIYFVKTDDAHTSTKLGQFDASYRREPFYSFSKGSSKFEFGLRVLRTRGSRFLNKILNPLNKGIVGFKYSYDKIWNKIIQCNDYDKTTIPGAFADWDNTARKQYNSQILMGVTPDKFGHYFSKLFSKCKDNGVPFIVINAWNEWAEGAYLEPDSKNGYSFLNEIKKIAQK